MLTPAFVLGGSEKMVGENITNEAIRFKEERKCSMKKLVLILAVLSMVAGHALATGLIISAGGTGSGVLYNGAQGSYAGNYSGGSDSTGDGYNGGGRRWDNIGNHYGTWTFTNLTAGFYSVHAFWAERGSDACTNLEFEVFDGTTSGTRLYLENIDQRAVPNDLTVDDGQGEHTWEALRSGLHITSGTLTVRATIKHAAWSYIGTTRVEFGGTIPQGTIIIIQ